MGWLRKVVYFCTLVDKQEIDGLGSYDQGLVVASFMRQLLGATFAFLVFFYATATIMPPLASGVLASILALIIFFLDQAIVGSEWTMHREASRHWFINGPVNFVLKIVQLAPRIAYAVAIAWFMASLAEITIQGHAIDRVLAVQTRTNNAGYFERTDEMEEEQRAALEALDKSIVELEDLITTRSDPSAAQAIAILEQQVGAASDAIVALNGSIASLRSDEQALQLELTGKRGRVILLEGEEVATQAAMDLEVNDRSRCRNPGAEGCKGPRWNQLSSRLIEVQDELGTLRAQVVALDQQLAATRDALDRSSEALQDAQDDAENATGSLQRTQRTTSSVGDLAAELETLETRREVLISDQNAERLALEELLVSTGNFETAIYGPLDRIIGLQKLHDDPVYGAAARQFSLELKIVVILFELSPVLVTIFFSPFSFLGLRMRAKRDDKVSEVNRARMVRELADAKSDADLRVGIHEVNIDASSQMAIREREVGISEARLKDQYDDEFSMLAEKRLERSSVVLEKEAKVKGMSKSENARNDDVELQDIENAIHRENRRAELYRVRRLVRLLEETADKPASSKGYDHD